MHEKLLAVIALSKWKPLLLSSIIIYYIATLAFLQKLSSQLNNEKESVSQLFGTSMHLK